MNPTINIAAYSDALVVLGTAGILVPIVSRLGISPTLGYLVAGAVLGPLGLGSFIRAFPPLYWFTVGDAANVLRDRIYRALHQGTGHQWAAGPGAA